MCLQALVRRSKPDSYCRHPLICDDLAYDPNRVKLKRSDLGLFQSQYRKILIALTPNP